MARNASCFRTLIAYETLERFTALVRHQQMGGPEYSNGSLEIISVTGHPQLHRSGPVNNPPHDHALPPGGAGEDAD